MSPPRAGPRTRAPADRDCETPSAWPYTDSSTVFEIRLESEGLARPCPPTTSASAMSNPIGSPTARPAKGIQRKPRLSAAAPRMTRVRSGSRRARPPPRHPRPTTPPRPPPTPTPPTPPPPPPPPPAPPPPPDHHPEPEGRADEPHAARALGRAGHVRDVRLRHRDARARHAGEHACQEEHLQPPGGGEQKVAHRRPRQAHEQHGPPSDVVRDAPPDRREDELHERVHPDQRAGDERRRVHLLGVDGQQRDDDPEAHEIDEDGQEEDDERRAAGGCEARHRARKP